MPLRLSLLVLMAVVFVSPDPAAALCEPGDFVCRKFNSSPKKETRSRPRRVQRRSTRTRAPRPEPQSQSVDAGAETETEEPVRTTMAGPIALTAPPVQLTTLPPGSIDEPPSELGTLVFGSNDRIETVTAGCRLSKHSLRRVDCTIAMHRLALTSGNGAGCLATLKMRTVELAKDEAGLWRHEEAIALCGGRLIRRTELFPVALNGAPQFAVREQYEMLGGNRDCAAPYLATRRPLERTFMPLGQKRTRRLQCGRVTAR
jgi:hypothetical protein